MNFSKKISVFIFLTLLSFVYTTTIFILKKSEISFVKKIQTPDQITVEKLVEKALKILKNNDELKTHIIREKKSLAIEQYNQIAIDYNNLNTEINSTPLFKENSELKKIFIETNNKAFTSIDSTRDLISNYKNRKIATLTASTSQDFNEKYDFIKQHSSINDFSLYTLNQSTLEFLIGLISFCLFSIASIWGLLIYSKKNKNFLIQKESELKTFLSVIDNMSEGVVVSDRFGFFTYYNQSALEIIGPNIKDVYYQSSIDLLGFHDTNGNNLEKIDSPFYKGVQKNIVTDQEIFVKNSKNPNGIYISASNGFYINEKGDTLGAIVVMKNISHKKQLEELWKKEKELAIEGSQKKSDFLASMSHEIRTPMNGIIGLTTLLSESPLNTEQTEFVHIIRRSANSLLALINDILDHSKIESGKIELIQNDFDLKFLMKDIIENFRFSCAEKNNKITFEVFENLSSYYVADENRIRQILINLIGNATKFTSNGIISIKIESLAESNKSSHLKFSITDTGPGMDKVELERLFQRFFQTKTGIKFGGTGLGLSICKQLIDLMSGKIGVNSKPGVGSTFWFELDLKKGSEVITEQKNIKLSDFENSFSGHVLVAEDNVINQKVIFQYLTKLGFTAEIANNGLIAYELFQKNKYDLIFMDCNMPVMNGYEATKKINDFQKKFEIKTKIIALTAEGQVTGLQKCLDAGMSDFINKPILIEEFITVLKKYFIPINRSNFDKTKLHKLKDLTAGDQLLIEVLFDEYIQTTPSILEQMNQSFKNNDADSVSDLAHSLKSSSGALGAKNVQNICQKIEDKDINTNNLLADLVKAFEESKNEINNEIQNIKSSQRIAS